ncbi:MAG: hypothetical protein M3N21_04685 [Actinomycetota bacterium]|nr:hypothetical protein [Actinomycetota bacterium]
MSRHRRDLLSLVSGLFFVLVGGLYLLGDAANVELDLRWIAPAVLIALGCVGLLGSLRRPVTRMDDAAGFGPTAPEPTTPG